MPPLGPLRRAPRRRPLQALAGLLLALLALLAPPSLARAEGREVLTIGISQYPASLHPNIESMVAKSYILGFVRRPLTAWDPDWRLVCLLCEELPTLANGLARQESTPDGRPGLRLRLSLRQGLRWGDGQPITAEDLRFAWAAGREPATGFGPAEFYRQAYELLVIDERSIELRLDRITFAFASMGDFQPLPRHLEEPIWQADPRLYRSRSLYERDPTHPGLWSGPWRVAAVQPGSAITLERNPLWSGPAPHFRQIRIRTVENTTALEAQLLAGQIDMIAGELGLPAEQAAALERRARGRFVLHWRPGLVYEHLSPNLDHPALADRRVRQALLLALDRQRIVAQLFEGRQTVAHGPLHPLDPMHDPAAPRWPFDPARAARLLAEAGWTPGPDGIRRNAAGERLSLELMTTAGNRSREQVQQVIAAQWRAVGVEVRIRNEPPRVLFGETLRQRRHQGFVLFAWVSSPEGVPRSSLSSTEVPSPANGFSGQNYAGFRHAELDAILEELPVTLQAEARRPLWSRLQAIYAEELPALPLWFRQEAHIWPRWLEGVRPTGHLNPSSLWAEEWRAR